MDATSLDATTRSVLGKKVSVLRRSGETPLHLYGRGSPPRALQASSSTVAKVVAKVGMHTPLYVRLDGGTEMELAFVREIQRDPITNKIVHVDLLRVDVAKSVRAEIPLSFVGEPPAVRNHGGVLHQSLHRVTVEGLPMEMPERIEVDLSVLEEMDQVIRVADLNPGSGITILGDLEEMVARIGIPRVSADRSAGAETATGSEPSQD